MLSESDGIATTYLPSGDQRGEYGPREIIDLSHDAFGKVTELGVCSDGLSRLLPDPVASTKVVRNIRCASGRSPLADRPLPVGCGIR